MGAALRAVLDTSVLIAAAGPAIEGEVAVSAASLAELHFGVQQAGDDDVRSARLRRLAEVESRFEVLPVDAQVARSYGALARRVVSSGAKPRARVMDLLIAATAHAHGAVLYTRDRHDFSAISRDVEVRVV